MTDLFEQLLQLTTPDQQGWDEARIKVAPFPVRNRIIALMVEAGYSFPQVMINADTDIHYLLESGYIYTGTNADGIRLVGRYYPNMVGPDRQDNAYRSAVSDNPEVLTDIEIINTGMSALRDVRIADYAGDVIYVVVRGGCVTGALLGSGVSSAKIVVVDRDLERGDRKDGITRQFLAGALELKYNPVNRLHHFKP